LSGRNLNDWKRSFPLAAAQSAKIATTEVGGVGFLQVIYARDPEGNIVELQKWR
jgi:hypothetical protein